jgi:peroxiredoxin
MPASATLEIGSPGPTFDGLLGVDGDRHALSDYDAARAIVLIFSSNRCPTAKAYGARMNALQATHGPRCVQLVVLNANDPHLYPDESYARMIERAAEDGYTFPYLVDEGQRLAKAYGATCTFHVFVLDQARRLRYEGRFDDARLEARVTRHDLEDVLDDLLADRPARVTNTLPFGCSLDFT